MVAGTARRGKERVLAPGAEQPNRERDATVVPLRRAPEPHGLDALVVGGGVIGLSCAWRIAGRGARVRVLERERPGAGASGVAAGMLAPVGEATWGEEALVELALASAAAWPGFATELAVDATLPVGYSPLGALHVALDRDEAEALRQRYELMRSLNLDAEWLRPSAARRLEPGLAPSVAAAVEAPAEAAADPRTLVAALVAALEACGGELITEAEVVESIIEAGRLVGVRTADGAEHRAGTVVLATGCWSGALGWLRGDARPPVRPVKGQILTLRSPATEPVCSRIVASERVYIVPREDGRLAVGATVEERGFDLRVTAGGVYELLREAYRAVPEIAELDLVETLCGMRPGTPDNAPLIGHGAIDGLLLATGHYRNGILLAPVTAEAITAMVAGEAPDVDLEAFDPARFAAAEALR
jgi:glycine oxidase